MVWKVWLAGSKTTLQRPKALDVGHSSRKLLWFFGIYPGKVIERYRFRELVRLLIGVIVMSQPYLMFLRLSSNNQLLEGWALLSGMIYLFGKTILYSYSTKVVDVESFLGSEMFNSRTVAQDRFLLRAIKYSTMYSDMVRFIGLVDCLYYAIFLPADVESIPSWVPFKPNAAILHVYEVAACVISLLIYAAVDVIVIALIANTGVQFQTLTDNLRNCCERNSEDSYAEQESKIRDRLMKCVIHHNTILRYIEKLREAFAVMLFWQIFCSVVGICLSGFQFLLVPLRSFRFILSFASVVAYLLQIFWYCLFSDDIIIQSSEIIRSCFQADWYLCSLATKKMLLLIMARATKSSALEVRPFFTLSLNTFVMILRNAYSYYAILCNIYKK